MRAITRRNECEEKVFLKNIQWRDAYKKFLGQVNIGGSEDELNVASNVIVFMINGLNRHINVPIAYYFINSLNATQKHALLHEIITSITKCGVKLIGVTFDGLVSNIAACELFGATFSQGNFQPHFQNPFDESKIFVFLDPPHMTKLARNCLASLDVM